MTWDLDCGVKQQSNTQAGGSPTFSHNYSVLETPSLAQYHPVSLQPCEISSPKLYKNLSWMISRSHLNLGRFFLIPFSMLYEICFQHRRGYDVLSPISISHKDRGPIGVADCIVLEGQVIHHTNLWCRFDLTVKPSSKTTCLIRSPDLTPLLLWTAQGCCFKTGLDSVILSFYLRLLLFALLLAETKTAGDNVLMHFFFLMTCFCSFSDTARFWIFESIRKRNLWKSDLMSRKSH